MYLNSGNGHHSDQIAMLVEMAHADSGARVLKRL
jgi:hypothetical protein